MNHTQHVKHAHARGVISSKVTGSNTDTLVLNSVEPSDSGEYKCIASSGDVSVESEYAMVTVLGMWLF